MYSENQYIREEDGLKCVWTYSSGGIDSVNEEDEEEEAMWSMSLSSIPDEDEEKEVKAKTPITPEPLPRQVSSRGNRRPFFSEQEVESSVSNAVSSALERARLRHSQSQKQQNREDRRSLVKSSVMSLSQRQLDLDSSSNHDVGRLKMSHNVNRRRSVM